MKKVSIIVIGAGNRGQKYARYARQHPDETEIVAVAEPREAYRTRFAEEYRLPPHRVYKTWQDVLKEEPFADAVIIATPDAHHEAPAIAFAGKGYNLLLEKPMAPTEKSCRRIVQAAIDNDILFAVCHVRRYTDYTQKIKGIIDSGAIGEVISIQLLEPVGY